LQIPSLSLGWRHWVFNKRKRECLIRERLGEMHALYFLSGAKSKAGGGLMVRSCLLLWVSLVYCLFVFLRPLRIFFFPSTLIPREPVFPPLHSPFSLFWCVGLFEHLVCFFSDTPQILHGYQISNGWEYGVKNAF